MELKENFFDFEKVSKAKWLEKVEKDLKGKPLSILQKELEVGLNVEAIYSSEDLPKASFEVHKEKKGWAFAETFSASSTNSEILEALSRGINEITIPYSQNLEKQIQGVETSFIDLNILVNSDEDLNQIKSNSVIASLKNTRIINDPLNRALKTGEKIDLSAYGSWNLNNPLAVDLLHLQNAGASAMQQMAAFLSTLSEYVSKSKPENLKDTFLRIGVSKNYFLEIAKLRAIRLVFETFCDANSQKGNLKILVETSWSDLAQLDSKTNILRTTTQAMSAILGGTDALAIKSYDHLVGNNKVQGARIARNIHHLLKEEAHVDAVDDPSKGAYFIENLTSEIADQGWHKFLEIEKEGGYLNALAEGWFQQQVMAVAGQKIEAVKSAEKTIIGVNKYDNAIEEAPTPKSLLGEERITATQTLDRINLPNAVETEKAS